MRVIRAGNGKSRGARPRTALILVAALLISAHVLPSPSAVGASTAQGAAKAKKKTKKCKAKSKRASEATKKKRCKKKKKKQKAPLDDGLSMDPVNLLFGSQTVGTSSEPKAFIVTNTGNFNSGHLQLAFGGPHQNAFPITSQNCQGAQLPAGATCVINLRFSPQAIGSLSTTLSVVGTQGGTDVSLLRGTGTL